jgi:assimilatory nitrate reductase catalytic subunit
MAIACSCHGVRDHSVHEAIGDGAASVEDVMEACAAGTSCGACVPTIEMLLAAEGAMDAAVGRVSAA